MLAFFDIVVYKCRREYYTRARTHNQICVQCAPQRCHDIGAHWLTKRNQRAQRSARCYKRNVGPQINESGAIKPKLFYCQSQWTDLVLRSSPGMPRVFLFLPTKGLSTFTCLPNNKCPDIKDPPMDHSRPACRMWCQKVANRLITLDVIPPPSTHILGWG